jgi:hypothetical protein
VVAGVQSAFLLMATFTRPVELRPAWSFSEEEVKPCSDHYVRWLQTMEPEKLSLLAKYMDPILGTVQLYSLYTLAVHREGYLNDHYASMVDTSESRTSAAGAGAHSPAASDLNGTGGTARGSAAPSNGSADGGRLPTDLPGKDSGLF